MLQGRVELRLVRRQSDMLAQVPQKFAICAAEAFGRAPADDEYSENTRLHEIVASLDRDLLHRTGEIDDKTAEIKRLRERIRQNRDHITGFLDNNNYIGRPVDVEFMADGSMLLSDDWNGAIYRITYGKAARVAGR